MMPILLMLRVGVERYGVDVRSRIKRRGMRRVFWLMLVVWVHGLGRVAWWWRVVHSHVEVCGEERRRARRFAWAGLVAVARSW